jgi:choline dehydrogenase-like flavoprotein
MTDIIIGSGPAAIAAAQARIARGIRVLMIDGGTPFAPADPDLKARLQATPPADWPDTDRDAWMRPQAEAAPGRTRRYGSDRAMEPPDATFADAGGVALRASRAAGGLSNLWGGAVLPYAARDIADWPVTGDDLAPHYRAVAAFLPATRSDAFDGLFPDVAAADAATLPPSPQAAALLLRLARHQDALAANGATLGPARQAVAPGCRACGMCLHGCPDDLIWSARHTLSRLAAHPLVTYRSGPPVRAIRPDGGTVRLTLDDGSELATAGRVFLGAGVLETARIVMASGLADALTLADSQQALVPHLHRWRMPVAPDRLPFHTLPQIFVEIGDDAVSPRLVHAQVYTWNDQFPRDLIANYGRLPGSAPLLRALARRLIVAQVFLHSDLSARIGLTLATDGRLIARAESNAVTAPALDRATRAVSRTLARGGLVPLAFARRIGAPGSSFHVGASLPMQRDPQGSATDRLGRPAGTDRLHVIDASVLPAIPATTITFSVMANAHRIAALAPAG